MDESYGARVGVELEGFCYRDGKPLPLDLDWLVTINDEAKKHGIPGNVTTDAGVGHIEFVTHPLSSPRDTHAALVALREFIPTSTEVHFVNKRPGMSFGRPTPWIDLPRLKTLLRAVSLVHPVGWQKVLHMSDFSSLHVTIDLTPDSPEGVLVINYFNLVTPWFAQHIATVFEEDNTNHLDAWLGWMSREYLPDPERWLSNPQALVESFESLCSLVSADSEGKTSDGWCVDLEGRKQWGRRSDEGSVWWFARPRKSYRSECSDGAVEIRIAPSMRPHRAVQVTHLISTVVDHLVLLCRGRNYESPDDAGSIFRSMNAVFPFLPETPPTVAEWYEQIAVQTSVR